MSPFWKAATASAGASGRIVPSVQPVDLGAAWIHGASRSQPISVLARELGISTTPTNHESLFVYDDQGRRVRDERFEELYTKTAAILAAVEEIAAEQKQDISIRKALELALAEYKLTPDERYVLNWIVASVIEGDLAGSLEELSARGNPEEDTYGERDELFPGGYDQIVRGLARGLDIKTGHVVRTVRHDARGVRVETERGDFQADVAVVTLPLGVLRRENVRFVPDLAAAKRQAIRRLSTGTLHKTVLQFPQAFWPADRDWLGYLAKEADHPCSVYLNFTHYTRQPILIALTGGERGRRLERESDAALQRKSTGALREIFGTDYQEPSGFLRTSWNNDAFSLGSYSLFPPGASADDYDALAEPAGRLLFAGEATHRTYPATVHGAYLSGVREAERVAKMRLSFFR